jgi:hypothetical protein
MKTRAITIIAIMLFAALALSGCTSPTPTPQPNPPGPTLAPTPDTNINDITDILPTDTDAIMSSQVLADAAAALEKNDKAAFLATLSSHLRPKFENTDFTTVNAKGLATALRSASLSDLFSTSIVYTVNADGIEFEIATIKEGYAWKIEDL